MQLNKVSKMKKLRKKYILSLHSTLSQQKLKNYNNSIINSFTNQSFVERRSNLNGKKFIGMTDNFYPYSNLDLNFIHAAMFHEDNQTYDVSHFAKGMLHTLHIHYTAL